MKYKISNPGPRALSVTTADGIAVIEPRKSATVEINGTLPKRIEAGLIAAGAKLEKLDDDAKLETLDAPTPEPQHENKKPAPEPADALAAMKLRADAAGLTYGNSIKLETLTERVLEAEKTAGK